MIKFLDKNFKPHKLQYVLQAVLGGLAICAVLFMFDIVKHPMVVASFGASVFIAFTRPHQKISSPRHLIGGYIIGIIVGVAIHYIFIDPIDQESSYRFIYVLAGGLAVCLTMFLMTITMTEHAPSTSIALGLVINDWEMNTVVYILIGIVVISLIQKALKPLMMDLDIKSAA